MELDLTQLFIGFLIGTLLTLFYYRISRKADRSTPTAFTTSEENFSALRLLEIEKAQLTGETKALVNQLSQITIQRDHQIQELQELISENGKLLATNDSLATQLKESFQIQHHLKEEFELLANKIFQTNSQTFQEVSHRSLKGLLDPLQEKMTDFKREINDKYITEAKDKASLKTEIAKLVELNTKLSDDANQLTNALKGDNKQHGNWGEVILEKVLERSGLIKGTEFHTQEHITTTDGSARIPDAVIFLPDNKHIIIDSKVSLIAYERMVNANSEQDHILQLKLHLTSLKSHIKELSDKRYYETSQLNSPEFTLLFLPIEASFSIALQEDSELFHYGWDRNIVMVSPTTLLATLRTIASIWKHEKQTKHVLEIAKEGGALHDKFVSFVEEMQKIEKNLDATHASFNGAYNKLYTGKGNLINRVNKLKILGAKANKALSSQLVDQAKNSDLENNTHE